MDITNDELSVILENRLSDIEAFELELKGFSKCEDRFSDGYCQI